MSRGSGKSKSARDKAEAAEKLLRELTERAERDPAFAVQLADAVRASGLLDSAEAAPVQAVRKKVGKPSKSARSTKIASAAHPSELPDPFHILRQRGEDVLRAALAELDIASLRQIVRTHRLDPARISARWTSTDRVIALIVEQVRARANHGRAFERI